MTGEILSQTYVGSKQPPLGNLAMHHGKLISLGPAGLTVFGQRDAVLEEIERRLAADPNDAWGLLRSSEIHLLNRNYSDAIPLLRRIPLDRLTVAEQERQHAALFECLSTLVHHDILQRTQELAELGRLAASPSEKLLFHELTAERFLAEQQTVAAFDVFAKLAEDAGEPFVTRSDDRHISVRRDVWLNGRMFEIWSKSS